MEYQFRGRQNGTLYYIPCNIVGGRFQLTSKQHPWLAKSFKPSSQQPCYVSTYQVLTTTPTTELHPPYGRSPNPSQLQPHMLSSEEQIPMQREQGLVTQGRAKFYRLLLRASRLTIHVQLQSDAISTPNTTPMTASSWEIPGFCRDRRRHLATHAPHCNNLPDTTDTKYPSGYLQGVCPRLVRPAHA
jgi:hypothetical protein